MKLAQSIDQTFGKIGLPSPLAQNYSETDGTANINMLIDRVVGLFFTAAAVAFILMFIWGAVQMILSGGDKEAIAKARAKITWSIIGVALLGLSYFIFQLLQAVTGFTFLV